MWVICVIDFTALPTHQPSLEAQRSLGSPVDLFIYLGFYVAFNTVQVISRQRKPVHTVRQGSVL